MRLLVGFAVSLLSCAAWAGVAQATPLNLLTLPPDVFSSLVQVDYDATGDILTADGTAFTFDDDGVGPQVPITAGTFSLTATVDAAGAASGGSLTIGGTIAGLGFNSGTLLTGTLGSFGFPDAGGDPLEFIFNVTGGDAAGLYGATANVVLTGAALPATLFASDFNNDGLGQSDTAVPEPSAAALALAGALGLVAAGRRRG